MYYIHVSAYQHFFSSFQKTVNDTTVTVVSFQLLNISKRAQEFSDPLDVVYAAIVVEKLAQAVGRHKIVRSMLICCI